MRKKESKLCVQTNNTTQTIEINLQVTENHEFQMWMNATEQAIILVVLTRTA